MASDRKVLEHDDRGHFMDKGGSEVTQEERVHILPTKRKNLVTSEEAERRTTPGGDADTRPISADEGVP